jgi:threonine synthase
VEKVLYKSTRGGESNVSSAQAILKGIAEDGGLFVPDAIPLLSEKLEDIINLDYKQLAYVIMSKFFTDFTESELKECIEGAYNDKFDCEEIAPVKKAGKEFYLELYHGPTLAFKDMALTILPYLLKTAVKKQKLDKEVVILTATSGDTGKAALEGFTDVEGIKIIVFFPRDGVSEVQKKQMTTHTGSNTFVVGIRGNFDDAQNGVKEIFNDESFLKLMEENNYIFSSANSINIGRLIPQVVYYFYAYAQLCRAGEICLGEKINFVVPTGNFGNILAAYLAKEMGLPINKLVCASNENKVLFDFMNSGVYDRRREFVTTISPSMDILISSNLERLLFFISGNNANLVKELMSSLNQEGSYGILDSMKNELKDFYGAYSSEVETKEGIYQVYDNDDYLIDTHTAVAYAAYNKYHDNTGDELKSVIVSTASPYKFTYSVMTSLDEKYKEFDDFELIKKMSKFTGGKVPEAIKEIEKKPVIHKTVCDKEEMGTTVKKILKIKE